MRYSLDRLPSPPIIGILRGFAPDTAAELIAAARRGGMAHLEVTMDTPEASLQIRRAVREHGSALRIGAGTVTSQERLDQALDAGATFIVTPTLSPAIISRCVASGIPVFPGALSPTEIEKAWDLGATMVKVFPSDGLGPRIISQLKEHLPQVALLPTGGVALQTLPEFLRAGASGVGVGSPLFAKDRVAARDWGWVEARCRAFVEAWQTFDIAPMRVLSRSV